ncbi:chromatin structure-remodeling complex subunit snf2 [Trichodelitschia bisporula]|uniref:Chromatin structure-remodeling complex subunit snf2 n=1 Tax=Trichodelitschia bisporula TaxID=703511 RepID=A0A6G1I8S6_9PEZI|nr:chromatin structure-remodeling complex subunit snf2 [Trichodelitschia bisporula]
MATLQQPGHIQAQASGVIPPNLTRDMVKQTYIKYQQMKTQNVREDDPEFIKARNLLQAVHQQNQWQKQKMMQQQQQQALAHQQGQQQDNMQQAQLQVQLPEQHQANGVAPQTLTNGTVMPSASGSENLPTAATNGSAAPSVAAGPSPRSKMAPSGQKAPASSFTKEQLALFKIQLGAFRQLTRNLPLPASIQQTLHTFSQAKQASMTKQVLATEEHGIENAPPVKESASVEPSSEPSKRTAAHEYLKSFTDPYSHVRREIGYSDHALRILRPQIPSIIPQGIDVKRMQEEREMIAYNRIMARKQELEQTHANIATWNARSILFKDPDDSIKRKALIEYKQLCLLQKQRQLRQHLSREMLNADNLAITSNRAQYRRVKKMSFREARVTEKLEKQQRDARESQEKKKHTDFLNSVIKHGEEIRQEAHAKQQRAQKLGRLAMAQHNHLEKEEQKRVERTARQRLQALKANDEETYLKLLGQAKDTRISHLLKQTDGFLNQLAASVREQQRSAVKRYGGRDTVDESSDESDSYDEDEDDEERRARRVDYYEVAHRKKEEIYKQSDNLVGGTLKEYQLKGLQWMISLYNNNLNGILADEMGLGKTIQTISLITYLIAEKQEHGPFLVIVPLSTLTNWNSEFDKWAPSVQKIVYKGPPNQRKQQQNQIRYGSFQVLLTTYEFVIKDRPILSKIKWVHMIVDEGHRMKNAGSKLSSTITQYYNTRYRLILTGTPLQNNLPELWALLNFVLPNIFKSVKSFDEWFNTPFANTGGQDKMELTEEEQLLVIRRLHKVLRPFLLRRLKRDVEKDLPDKTERVIKCSFSALQARLYKQLVNHNRLTVSDGKGGKTGLRGLSNMLMQLRKLCNHPFVFEEVEDQMNPTRSTNDLLWRTSGKFELLDRILPKFQATNHRVLMFFQMTQIMNIMEDFLRLRNIKYLRLDGSTKADDRSELLRLFNAPNSEYFCFLLSTRAGGLGLNLQTADTVIIYDSDWNPHQDLQAQDRAHRIGQKNEVRILRLITTNSVEEKILERANFKLDMDGKVIQAGKFDNKSTNEERDAMLRVMLESAEAAETLEQEEQDDDDLNVIMMRSEDELKLFQQMDQDRITNAKYGPGKKYPRLLCDEELPELYLMEDNPVVEEVEEPVGRGARERTRVRYDDGLTEEQWLDAVDNDEDTIEEAIARKEAKQGRREKNRDKKTRTDQIIAESPRPSRDSSESPMPKKRGRKPKAEKRKAEEAGLDADVAPPPKKRGRPGNAKDTLTPANRAILQKILNAVYDALLDLEEESTDPDLANRGIIDPFLDLPDKNDYPEYYVIITNPICMKQIQKKINKKEYQNLYQFRTDIGLLCNNCRTFNEDGSILYKDANLIEQITLKRLREETENYPELQGFDDGGSSTRDGQSTAPVSSAGTPLAQAK